MSIKEPFFGFDRGLAAAAYRQRMLGARRLAPVKGALALDLGCGRGEEAADLCKLGYRVDALDLAAHPDWKTLAKAHPGRLHFREADASDAVPAGRYDLVVAKDMLHHAADPVQVLRRMAAAVKPGGSVIITEANRWNPVFYVHLTLLGEHDHFSLRKLRRLLAEAGMAGGELRRIEARVWPVNRAWAQRLVSAAQDLLQALPVWWPFVCYHVYAWKRPVAAGKKRAASRRRAV